MNYSALLVEDSLSLSALYTEYLRAEDIKVTHAHCGADALSELSNWQPDLLILDIKLPDMSGLDILKQVQQRYPHISTIMITAHGSIDIAIDAMRSGAFDFLVKPFDSKRLSITVRNALKQKQLLELVTQYENSLPKGHYQGFIGDSLAMQSVYKTIDCVANSKASVFIMGESGTGKEVCAQAIHQVGNRADKPFIALNCASIPKDLIESEIFGHCKGAFTGAHSNRDGAATRADGGTLFLDEICEMDLELQSKLLRFIQTGTFQRVGGSKEEHVDIRFISATNREPWEEVKLGHFREDLFYRLHVIPIELPPLRARGSDVLLLAKQLLKTYSKEEGKQFVDFNPQAASMLQAYDWPGNVRQLQNVIRQIVVLNDASHVEPSMFPAPLKQASQLRSNQQVHTNMLSQNSAKTETHTQPNNPQNIDNAIPRMNSELVPESTPEAHPHIQEMRIQPLWLTEKQTIEGAIALCDGNVPKAAALLDISPSTIYRKRMTWEEQAERST